jgi:hypothetical protein
MNRRESLKLLITGSLATGLVATMGCQDDPTKMLQNAGGYSVGQYGRTPEEIAHDAELLAETFFTEAERAKLDILVDIIVPRDEVSGSATDVKVPDFIEFMMKDFPPFQTRMRGGLAWLDHECNKRFGTDFVNSSPAQRMEIIDEIAWPDEASPDKEAYVRFFTTLRNLTVTGFYTTAEGFRDLGYMGNTPNEWDGVPQHVMQRYGLEPDPKYRDVYLKTAERNIVAQWDEDGNLIG